MSEKADLPADLAASTALETFPSSHQAVGLNVNAEVIGRLQQVRSKQFS